MVEFNQNEIEFAIDYTILTLETKTLYNHHPNLLESNFKLLTTYLIWGPFLPKLSKQTQNWSKYGLCLEKIKIIPN